MTTRLLLSAAALLGVLSFLAPGASACEKHLRAHASDSAAAEVNNR